MWKNPESRLAVAIFYFLSTYVIVLLIFVFCYAKIIVAIRRQSRVMASHNPAESSTAQTQSNQIQSNVIKTMILVCAFYAIAWLPEKIFILLLGFDLNVSVLDNGYYLTMFLGFLYICTSVKIAWWMLACWVFEQISFIMYNIATISLYLRQPVYLRHKAWSSQMHPERSDSVWEGLWAS